MEDQEIENIRKECNQIISHFDSYFELNNFHISSILSAILIAMVEMHVYTEADDSLLLENLVSLIEECRELHSCLDD